MVALVSASSQQSGALHAITAHASSPWLDRFNAWRAATALPSLTENTTWDTGDYDHSVYMVKNDLVTHYETVGTPYYTVDGDQAARNGNIFVSSTTTTSDTDAIDWWMQAPFHALGMMDPRLTSTGFGSYREVKSGWDMGATLDVLRGNSFTGGTYPVYFPGNGSTEPLTTYGGGEFPDPLQDCSAYTAPTGLPVFIQVGGNVATAASLDSFTGNGVPLPHCVLDSTSANVGSNLTYRGAVVIIPRNPLQVGVHYVVAVTVNGTPYTWAFTVGTTLTAFNPNACTSMTASALPGSPQPANISVTISGTALGCPNARYRFWVLPPGGSWQMVQDYSATSTYSWTTPPTPGVYHLEVDARDQTSVTSYDTAQTILFTVTGCTSAGLSPSVAQPQAPGATVTFTASATGCSNPEYKFFLQAPGGSWTAQTSYGTGSWGWNTTGLTAGVYGVGVWVHSIGSAASYEAYYLGTYTLGAGACNTATLTTPTASPQAAGASVTFTAGGCAGGAYRFWLLPPGGSWTMKQDYGVGSTWAWNTSGLAAGTYEIGVWAKAAGSSNSYDTYAFTTFVIGSAACAASLSPSVAAPQTPGATVTFTAASTGCTSPLYKFWLLPPGGAWTAEQGYSSTATWAWNTTGAANGVYQVGVWAKASASANSYDAYYIGTYVLSVGPCTSASLSSLPAGPQTAGTPVTFTASSTGCSAPQYEFWELAPSGSWTMVQAYSTSAKFVWTTSAAAAGTYRFGVWAKQTGSANNYDTYAITTDWITP